MDHPKKIDCPLKNPIKVSQDEPRLPPVGQEEKALKNRQA